MQLLGWEIKKQKQEPVSFAPKQEDDGAVTVVEGGIYGTYVDLDGSIRTEAELVSKYREMAQYPDVDAAIDDIVNEVIVEDSENEVVEIILDDLDQPDRIKSLLVEEFKEVLKLLEFNHLSYEVFRRWYVDGRLYYHAIINEENTKEGIQELRYIDPRKIRKIREVKAPKNTLLPPSQTGAEYYVYNDKGFAKTSGNSSLPNNNIGAVKIAKDSIVHCTSGITSSTGDLIMSYLHKAIKPLNQLASMEDSLVIYRISRAPERRIFYIDVGDLPKMKAEQHLRDVMTKFKNRLVYDSATGAIRDDRKFMCYALDTKIPLLDGRTLTLQELIDEYESGKLNWAYSCDPITGKFVPGPVSWAGITKRATEVVKVTFDNGKSVVCTPDHKFPVWGEGFVEAKDLLDKSVIPGYRRNRPIMKDGCEYEQIYKNDTKTWEFTHREVSKWKEETGAAEEFVHLNKHKGSPKTIIHHQNFNRFDNSPEILHNHKAVRVEFLVERLDVGSITIDQNETYHSHHTYLLDAGVYTKNTMLEDFWLPRRGDGRGTEITTLPGGCLAMDTKVSLLDGRELSIRDIEEEMSTGKTLWTYSCDPHTGKIVPGLISWAGVTQESAQVMSLTLDNGEEIICTPDHKFPVWGKGFVEAKDLVLNESMIPLYRQGQKDLEQVLDNETGSWVYTHRVVAEFFNEEFTNNPPKVLVPNPLNHRIVGIKYLDDKIQVGTLTIDQNEDHHDYHTFALSCGIFTKNSNLGEMDDVIYFQKKLYRSLNVPVTRLDSETMFNFGRTSEVTRDEVKFSKFIGRLRNKFSILFNKILERQLILKGIITPEEWEDFKNVIRYKFAHDNYYAELKETEILRDRMAMMRDIDDYTGKYYSHEWVRRNVLHQSDEDIAENDKQIAQEIDNPQYHPPQPTDQVPGEPVPDEPQEEPGPVPPQMN